MISVLSYFAFGAGAGVVTGIPLGPVNGAVIDAAYRHHFKRALAVGLGGALADTLYAFLGVKGFGVLLESYPTVAGILMCICGLFVIAYGIVTARAAPPKLTKEEVVEEDDPARPAGYFWGGLGLGMFLILINPGALIGWGIVLGTHGANATFAEGNALAIGVGVGSFVWFSFIAWAADRGKRMLGKNAAWLGRFVGAILVIGGLVAFCKGVMTLFF